MCLFGAARITHRAQRIVSIASQWHMGMVHHGKPAPEPGVSTSASDDAAASGACCAYKSRQALGNSTEPNQAILVCKFLDLTVVSMRVYAVTYLWHNSGGITLFGFTLDRGLLHTIFAFEMTLVLWILSKAVVLS